MKDNKICFNKTLTYLVLLVVAVVGAFWVMNYANTQNLGGTPKAAGDCSYLYKGVNYTIPEAGCAKDYVTEWQTSYKCVSGHLKKPTDGSCNIAATPSTGCKSGNFSVGVGVCFKTLSGWPQNNSLKCLSPNYARKDPTCATNVTGATCTANVIANKALDSSWCRYNTGVVKSNNTCALAISYDSSACTPAVGQPLGGATASATCTANKVVKVYVDGTCQYETGVKRSNGTCVLGYETDNSVCAGNGATSAVDWTQVRNDCLAKKGTMYQNLGTDVNGTLTCFVYDGNYSKSSKGRAGNYCVTTYKAGSACQ